MTSRHMTATLRLFQMAACRWWWWRLTLPAHDDDVVAVWTTHTRMSMRTMTSLSCWDCWMSWLSVWRAPPTSRASRPASCAWSRRARLRTSRFWAELGCDCRWPRRLLSAQLHRRCWKHSTCQHMTNSTSSNQAIEFIARSVDGAACHFKKR